MAVQSPRDPLHVRRDKMRMIKPGPLGYGLLCAELGLELHAHGLRLRFWDVASERWLPSSEERATLEAARADQESRHAMQQSARANREAARAEQQQKGRLAAEAEAEQQQKGRLAAEAELARLRSLIAERGDGNP